MDWIAYGKGAALNSVLSSNKNEIFIEYSLGFLYYSQRSSFNNVCFILFILMYSQPVKKCQRLCYLNFFKLCLCKVQITCKFSLFTVLVFFNFSLFKNWVVRSSFIFIPIADPSLFCSVQYLHLYR